MPTIHTGSSTGLRCSLASRSVPMLPGPIRAHLIFFMGCLLSKRGFGSAAPQAKRSDTVPRSWKRTAMWSPACTAMASVTPPVMMKLPAGISCPRAPR